MSLSNDILSQFAKVTKPSKQNKKESLVNGTIVLYNGQKYVQFDGSDLLTPITADTDILNTTTDVQEGDRVTVRIKNHEATVTGNLTSPAPRIAQVTTLESGLTVVSAEVGKFQEVYVEDLKATNAEITNLKAKDAEIDNLVAKKANIEELQATNATITNLKTENAEIKKLVAEKATIENLKATNAEITNLKAKDAEIDNLVAKKANIDFANINMAAVEQLFTKSGIIKDLVVGDTSITGELVGVTIKGDLIEGNTIAAEKLVIKGEDGLYYKLNVNALGETTASADEKYQNGLDGSVIVAKSITAEKVNVHDLVAFGATIGGFHITDDSLYSGVKASATNTTRGVFLGDDGQFAAGDQNNFVKFYKDTDGSYKLAISAESLRFSSNNKTVESTIEDAVNGIEVGGRNYILNSTFEGLKGNSFYSFDENSVVIFKNGDTSNNTRFKLDLSNKAKEDFRGRCLMFSMDYKINETIVYGTTKPWIGYQLSIAYTDGTANSYLSWFGQTFPTEVCDWTRKDVGVIVPDKAIQAMYLWFYGRDFTGSVSFKHPKIELGTIATDWTLAPEDDYVYINSSVENAQSSLSDNITEAKTKITEETDEKLQNYVGTSKYDEDQKEINDKIDDTKQYANNVSSLIAGIVALRFDEVGTYVQMDENGLTLGKEGNPIKLEIDHDRIRFLKNGTPYGWWDGENFHTGNVEIEVKERAQFGNFAFIPRSDGSLSFLKVDSVISDNLFDLGNCTFETNAKDFDPIGSTGATVYVSSATLSAVHFTLDSTKKYRLTFASNNAKFSGYGSGDDPLVISSGEAPVTFTGVNSCYFYISNYSTDTSFYTFRDVRLVEVS